MKNIKLPKNIILPKGVILKEAPSKIDLFGVWYEYIIPIGNDNTASFLISEDDLKAINELEPEVSIL